MKIDVSLYEHQIGGQSHKGISSWNLLKSGNQILKPLQKDKRGQTELEFYESISSDPSCDELRKLAPRFYGLVQIDSSQEKEKDKDNLCGDKQEQQYLRLEDLTFQCVYPCVADIKIGKFSYDQNASPEKIAREVEKYPWQEQIGFRMIGFKAFDCELNRYVTMNKQIGRSLRPEQISEKLAEFVSVLDKNMRNFLVQEIITKLKGIHSVVRNQRKFNFRATSILIVFDSVRNGDLKCQVRIIDFAHALPMTVQEEDENYLYGIENLIKYFGEVERI
jgi:1D-myo-inositol-tetrakisphosphate 5-kinase/inositol-polyphosphate multikinase